MRAIKQGAFTFDVNRNVKPIELRKFDAVVLPTKNLSAVCCTYTDGYPKLEVCADSDSFRHRSPWTFIIAYAPYEVTKVFHGPVTPASSTLYQCAMLRAYTHAFALSRVTAPTGSGKRLALAPDPLGICPPSAAASDSPSGTRWLHEWCCGPSSLISSHSSTFLVDAVARGLRSPRTVLHNLLMTVQRTL